MKSIAVLGFVMGALALSGCGQSTEAGGHCDPFDVDGHREWYETECTGTCLQELLCPNGTGYTNVCVYTRCEDGCSEDQVCGQSLAGFFCVSSHYCD